MYIVVFDTETTSLDKPFCYNIGYVIADVNSQNIIARKNFVVEQVWHNKMCFASAYYADKRPIYVQEMRKRSTIMEKFGYICQEMIRDFSKYDITMAFAYNSSFDERVFNFNCDWFKCNNPFDNVEIKDIRGFAHHFIVNDNYLKWCEDNEKFTESGNYSTTAETVKQYISQNIDFVEDHTALSDSEIECEILFTALNNGAEILGKYDALQSIKRTVPKILTIIHNKKKILEITCESYRIYKSKNEIVIK